MKREDIIIYQIKKHYTEPIMINKNIKTSESVLEYIEVDCKLAPLLNYTLKIYTNKSLTENQIKDKIIEVLKR